MFNIEINDRDIATKWLAASSCLTCIKSLELNKHIKNWILAVLTETPELPPIGIIADLGILLTEQTGLTQSFAISNTDPELRNIIRAYEDYVLNKLITDSRLRSAKDAYQRLSSVQRPLAVGFFVKTILERLKFDTNILMAPEFVRNFAKVSHEEIQHLGLTVLECKDDINKYLINAYKRLIELARISSSLLADSDIFILENFTVLNNCTQRLAINHILTTIDNLSVNIPQQLITRHKSEGDIITAIKDEGTFPIGGFSSMSTSGSFENLVTSELIYMDNSRTNNSTDIFDLRYVEGELLYFTRDESVCIRPQRNIFLFFDEDLVEARIKDKNIKWQRLVLWLGLTVICVRKLISWLNSERINFHFVFLKENEANKLSQERMLIELLLKEFKNTGIVSIRESKLSEELTILKDCSQIGLTEIVYASVQDKILGFENINNRVRGINVNLKSSEPKIQSWPKEIPMPIEGVGLDAWQSVTVEILNELI